MTDARDLTNPLAPFTEGNLPQPIHHDDLSNILAGHQPFVDPKRLETALGNMRDIGTDLGVNEVILRGALIRSFNFSHQMTGIEFDKCAFYDSNFYGSDMKEMKLDECLFVDCRFSLSILSQSRFFSTRFHRCRFDNCVIADAEFHDCAFDEVDFGEGIDLSGAGFFETTLHMTDVR